MIVRIVTIFTAFPTGHLAQCLAARAGQPHPVCPARGRQDPPGSWQGRGGRATALTTEAAQLPGLLASFGP